MTRAATEKNIRPGRKLFLVSCKQQSPAYSIQKFTVRTAPSNTQKLYSFEAELKTGEALTLFSDHVGLTPSKRHASGLFFTRLQAKKYARRHLKRVARQQMAQRKEIRKSIKNAIGI